MNSSSINTRLFIEGREIDLDENIEIPITYGLATVQDISKKTSPHTMSIKIPGTHNNNIAFNNLYDITSTGNYFVIPATYTAKITNACPSLSVTAAALDGSNFSLPIANGFNSTSYHNQLYFKSFNVTVSGNTDSSGYVVYKVNGNVIGCNKITGAVTNYCFPPAQYNYDDVLEIVFQTTYQAYDGNIGISFDAKKKARAYVIQDGAVILSGYAQVREAGNKNGLINYTIQITSDLGGFSSILQNARLEDLYSTLDINGNTAFLDSPYDHQFTISNITGSWFVDTAPYVYPLIDYGNESTVNQTNFYTSNFRPALFAIDYWNKIFENAGYTWESTFLSSPYFASLIIPFSDGNISLSNLYPVEATSNNSTTIVYTIPYSPSSVPGTGNGLNVFDTLVSDVNGVYDTTIKKYTAPIDGIYNFSTNLTAQIKCTPTSLTSTNLVAPLIDIYIQYRIFNADGSTPIGSPINVDALEFAPYNSLLFSGSPIFVGTSTSDAFSVSQLNYPIYLTAGQYVEVYVCPTRGSQDPNTFPTALNHGVFASGSLELDIVKIGTVVQSDLQIGRSTNIDGASLKFIDFVPKNIKQIDYVQSIVKLFDLYPEPDSVIPNKINFYTRDEYFNNNSIVNWTDKIDNSDDCTIKPIPSLDAKQLLFSYQSDADWWNKQYSSIYSKGVYGEARIDTGYQFSNSVKSVMDGSFLFGATPLVQFSPQTFSSEGPIEILNQPFTFPGSDVGSDIIMASGYYAANGNVVPIDNTGSVRNTFSGTPFTNAKVGVHIIYWNTEYIIKKVFNPYCFQVSDLNGNSTTLKRPIIVPLTTQRVNNTYYATNDGFQYKTNSNVVIPAIYESSDNNATHKPTKTKLKILFYNYLPGAPKLFNPIYIQYTPILSNGNYAYWNSNNADGNNSDGGQPQQFYPWCGHLDDFVNPTKDLCFGKPAQLFFNLPTGATYPTSNIYSRFWVNSVNEITDEDSKYLEANVRLNSVDISNLDLSSNVQIGNTRYRINSINNYNPSDDKLTKIELIRVPKFQQVTGFPNINAGPDQSVMLPTSTLTFAGTATPSDDTGETIVSTLWSQISGPNTATITTPSSLTSTVTGLIEGTYVFQLFGLDNYGISDTDTMSTEVVAHVEIDPTTTSSNNGPITLPVSTINLTGTATAYNGASIVSTAWTLVSGPMTPTITSPSSLNTSVTGITAAGTYVFRLTATDDFAGTGHSDTSVTVNPAINITIGNAFGTANITGISGTSTLTPSFTGITGMGTYSGTFGSGFTGAISVTRTGTVPAGPTFHARLTKNGVLVGTAIQADSTSTYTFPSTSFLVTDTIAFTLST